MPFMISIYLLPDWSFSTGCFHSSPCLDICHASPCTYHVSSSLPAYIDLILFPYCFRIVSASGSENDRRTIGERYGNDTGSIRDQYGIDTRTVFSDSQPKKLIRNLTFSSSFLLIIFYISATRLFLPFMPRSHAHHLPWRSLYTKITFRPAECKPISMN